MRADPPPSDGGGRPRRPPPPFRRAVVARRRVLGPRLVRVTVAGAELEGFPVPEPAASVRLLLPSPGAALVVPSWTGNEFLLPDGRRPVIRTLTPRRVDPGRGELDVDVVVHGEGAASRWAHEAGAGQPVAVSGPGRGTALDPGARAAVVAGDETALTAVAQVLAALPETTPVVVLVETVRVGAGEPAPPLPARPGAEVRWLPRRPDTAPGEELVGAVAGIEPGPGTVVWAAGEAAAMQRLRRLLAEEWQLARHAVTVRGYWKAGRPGGDASE